MTKENILIQEARLMEMSIAQLSTKIGVSDTVIRRWMNPKTNSRPMPHMVGKLRELGFSDKAIANPHKDI